MKWIWVIVLFIIGVLAAIVAVEYFTVSIGHLPSFIPGHQAGHHGHYRKRGAVAAVIAFVALVAAAFLAYRALQTESSPSTPAAPPAAGGTSADQLLSSPAPSPAPESGTADDQ